jgi:hypothetical protein
LVPVLGIKRGFGSLVGDDELKACLGGCVDALPTEELSVSPQKNLLHAPGQMVFDSADEDGTFLPIQDVSLAEFTQKAFPGFIHKTQHRSVCFLPSMGGVISHSASLLIPIDRFRSGIDTEVDPPILQPTELPSPFPQDTAHLKNRVGLIDTQAVHVPPEGAGCRQTDKLEETANHSIQTNIDKMPQSIETNEEQYQNPDHHPAVTQFGISARPLVNAIENLFKPKQIHKLDQPQQPTKRAKPLGTGSVWAGSHDFAGPIGLLTETFTKAIFRASMKSLVNHLGYLLSVGIGFGKLNPTREPRWFSIFYSDLGARLRS